MFKLLILSVCLISSAFAFENNAKLIMDGDGQTYLIYEGSTYQIIEMVKVH